MSEEIWYEDRSFSSSSFIFFLALLSILELFCHFANLKCKNGSGQCQTHMGLNNVFRHQMINEQFLVLIRKPLMKNCLGVCMNKPKSIAVTQQVAVAHWYIYVNHLCTLFGNLLNWFVSMRQSRTIQTPTALCSFIAIQHLFPACGIRMPASVLQPL